MLSLLFVQTLIWFRFLPNQAGKLSVDFSLWLPNALAGYFWHVHNPIWTVPWFTPAECAGIPFHADPQGAYLSLLQFLTFVVPPVEAVRGVFLAFAMLGFWGAWHLARRTFALSVSASLLAGALFMLNGFFSVRMVVGHLTYAPFMLLPALAACVVRPPGLAPAGRPEQVLRTCGVGLIVAISIEAGMIHILPPLFLSALMIGVMHAMRFGRQRGVLWRLVLGGAAGCALCAGKLAAAFSLLANFPRDQYPLPGVAGALSVAYVALRSLFTPVSDAMGQWVVNSAFLQEQHEFEYGVSLAPLLLMGLACGFAWRRGWRPTFDRLAVALVVLLLIPLILNIYSPGWNAVLKALPFFGSSSTLIRWFSAYILVAILAGAVALDNLADGRPNRAAALSACGIAIMLMTAAWSDHEKYGPSGMGNYDASELDAAWQKTHATGSVPAVTQIVELLSNGQMIMTPERQNALASGFSTLHCYEPLFGYGLENMPIGQTRLGLALDAHDGVFNVKNPACEVFPGANQCRPGDDFPVARRADAEAFLDYRPFAFERPFPARLADTLSHVSLLALIGLLGWSWAAFRRAARAGDPT